MNHFLAQAIGFIAMIFCIGSYQLKSSRMLILCKGVGDTVYVAHYLMLGAYSGCATLVVCAFNDFVCGFRGNRWAEWRGWKWLFSALLIFACLIAWRKSFRLIPCSCALISILVVIWSSWSGSPRVIRLCKLLITGPTWLTYCLFVQSYSGILCEVIGMISAAVSLYRYREKRQKISAKVS